VGYKIESLARANTGFLFAFSVLCIYTGWFNVCSFKRTSLRIEILGYVNLDMNSIERMFAGKKGNRWMACWRRHSTALHVGGATSCGLVYLANAGYTHAATALSVILPGKSYPFASLASFFISADSTG